jgi:hypothetical protein
MYLEEKLRSVKNDCGVNLYDHILNIIGKVMLDQERSPYENFERISVEIKKKDNFLGFSPTLDNLIREEGSEFEEVISKMRKFLKIQIPVVEEVVDEENRQQKEPEEEIAVTLFSNVIEQETISRKCGVSIGEDTAFYIQNTLRLFSASRGGQKCSFWGKITGVMNDYFIFESPTSTSHSVTEDTEESRKDMVDEHNGIGVNLKYYFVTTDLISNKWEELPAISARQLRQAKELRYLFTGDLKRKIISSPEFDGEERHFVG